MDETQWNSAEPQQRRVVIEHIPGATAGGLAYVTEPTLQVHVEDDHHALIQWNGREVMVYVQDGNLAVVVMAPGKDTIKTSDYLSTSGVIRTGTVLCIPASAPDFQ